MNTRNWMLVIVFSLTCFMTAGAFQFGFTPQSDQVPPPAANQIFADAFNAECAVFQTNNPGSSCGTDTLIRNLTLPALGFTGPVGQGASVTRYGAAMVNIDQQLGHGATFFVFAHEIGHHFDNQAPNAKVPWVLPGMPPTNDQQVALLWGRELRADAWAGCALKRTGVPLWGAQNLTALAARQPVGVNNPPTQSVVDYVNAGYYAC